MIAAALEASGRRTGLHTKPHLSSVTERARVDGIAIPDDDFGDLIGELQSAAELVSYEHGRPTYYEMLLALAFLWFARCEVDVAVIEAGVGGTLDGTNVLRPQVSVITNVALDHTDILGETVEEIARDKAGIAKPGVPLVSDAREPVARAVIEERCLAVGAPFFAVEEHAQIERRRGQRFGQAFDVVTERARYGLELPVVGPFQRRNAATAIVALEQMLPLPGDPPVAATIVDGFAQLVIPGRMECFPARPAVVFDIAHNPDKAQSLADALREEFPGRRLTFVVAIGDGKDSVAVLERLFPLPAGFVFTTFETAGRRAVRPQRLASIAQSRGHWARTVVDPVEALSVARRSTDSDGVVVVTGSTFLVATLRDWWLSNVGAPTRR
jgi:dihydrofolate synthase/folylpolyglutamate synthase